MNTQGFKKVKIFKLSSSLRWIQHEFFIRYCELTHIPFPCRHFWVDDFSQKTRLVGYICENSLSLENQPTWLPFRVIWWSQKFHHVFIRIMSPAAVAGGNFPRLVGYLFGPARWSPRQSVLKSVDMSCDWHLGMNLNIILGMVWNPPIWMIFQTRHFFGGVSEFSPKISTCWFTMMGAFGGGNSMEWISPSCLG